MAEICDGDLELIFKNCALVLKFIEIAFGLTKRASAYFLYEKYPILSNFLTLKAPIEDSRLR
jgi:hypothetical protein